METDQVGESPIVGPLGSVMRYHGDGRRCGRLLSRARTHVARRRGSHTRFQHARRYYLARDDEMPRDIARSLGIEVGA